jgi:hypothetical protein
MSHTPLTGSLLKQYNNLPCVPPDAPLGDILNELGAPGGAQLVFISTLDQLPAPVGGVITLAANTAYWFTQDIDLLGDRFVCSENTVILGSSSENVRITSTGLVGTALITSTWSLPMRDIAVEADVALDLDGGAMPNTKALDWFGVNFDSCGSVGRIANYNNFIMADSAFLEAGDLTFDGTINTIGFSQCLFNPPPGQIAINIPATAVVGRRLRVVYSSFVVLAGETGVNVNVAASIPVEGYILDTVNFSGGGTYTAGVLFSDNKAQFLNCRGVPNSSSVAQYTMNGNATATVVGAPSTFVKVAGVTTPGAYVQRFTLTSNRAAYAGSLTGFFAVSAIGTITAQSNREIAFRIAVDGVTIAATQMSTNSEGTARSAPLTTQGVVQLALGSFVEVFVANLTDATNVTVADLNVMLEPLVG